MNRFALILIATLGLGLSACTDLSGHSQNSYTEADVGKAVKVEFGKIISMRNVEIQGEPSGAGTAGGLVAGGAAGSTLGNGGGSIVTVIGGAILGGIIGNTVEKASDKRQGIEYIVRKDGGKIVSVVQNIAKDDVPLHVGERVMVQTRGFEKKGDYMRVMPAPEGQ